MGADATAIADDLEQLRRPFDEFRGLHLAEIRELNRAGVAKPRSPGACILGARPCAAFWTLQNEETDD
jgi:hypothetical protein